jgi:hypothetical protein
MQNGAWLWRWKEKLMKYLKTLGLALMATAALMAFVGAGSASAGVLCKNETDPCTNKVKVGESVNSAIPMGKATFINTGAKNMECKNSTFSGEVEKEGGEGAVPEVKLKTFTFTNCNCEVFVISSGTYYVSNIVGTGSGRPFGTGQEIKIQCNTILFGVVKCTYLTNNTLLGQLVGGNPAIFEINAELPLKAGSDMPCKEGIWTGEYDVSTPKPLYVASK